MIRQRISRLVREGLSVSKNRKSHWGNLIFHSSLECTLPQAEIVTLCRITRSIYCYSLAARVSSITLMYMDIALLQGSMLQPPKAAAYHTTKKRPNTNIVINSCEIASVLSGKPSCLADTSWIIYPTIPLCSNNRISCDHFSLSSGE